MYVYIYIVIEPRGIRRETHVNCSRPRVRRSAGCLCRYIHIYIYTLVCVYIYILNVFRACDGHELKKNREHKSNFHDAYNAYRCVVD